MIASKLEPMSKVELLKLSNEELIKLAEDMTNSLKENSEKALNPFDLKLEGNEVAFWERVFLTFCEGNKGETTANAAAARADMAVLRRRARFNPGSTKNGPYQ